MDGHPDWLDHAALDVVVALAVEQQPDPDTRAALKKALGRGEAELVLHSDHQGEWVGVRVLGQRLTRAHRSRVQLSGWS